MVGKQNQEKPGSMGIVPEIHDFSLQKNFKFIFNTSVDVCFTFLHWLSSPSNRYYMERNFMSQLMFDMIIIFWRLIVSAVIAVVAELLGENTTDIV